MRFAAHEGPEGEVVPVIIGVVEEAAVFYEQLAGIDGHFAAVPSHRLAAEGALEGVHREANELLLLFTRVVEMIDPAVAVTHDFIAALVDLFRDFRVALQGYGGAKNRDGDAVAIEGAEHSPNSGASAVFVH